MKRHPDLKSNDHGLDFGDWTIGSTLTEPHLAWLTDQLANYATEQGFGQAEFVAWLEATPRLGACDYDADGVQVFIGDEDPLWTPILALVDGKWVTTHLGDTLS